MSRVINLFHSQMHFLRIGTKATQSWYDEIKDYNFNRPGFSMSTGHFTQVVWKSTTKLGMGIGFADGGRKVIVVAQYGPAGNMMGDFPQNVPRPN
jgi:glioma pathogenesis-related protein 2